MGWYVKRALWTGVALGVLWGAIWLCLTWARGELLLVPNRSTATSLAVVLIGLTAVAGATSAATVVLGWVLAVDRHRRQPEARRPRRGARLGQSSTRQVNATNSVAEILRGARGKGGHIQVSEEEGRALLDALERRRFRT